MRKAGSKKVPTSNEIEQLKPTIHPVEPPSFVEMYERALLGVGEKPFDYLVREMAVVEAYRCGIPCLHATGKSAEGWREVLEEKGLRLVYLPVGRHGNARFLGHKGFVELDGHGHLWIVTFDPDIAKLAVSSSLGKNSNFHVLTSSVSSGLYLQPIMPEMRPFVPTNYPADVAAAFDTVCENLCDPQPRGRLFLFEGPKGTGKTSFIEAVIERSEAFFIFLPSHMLSNLADPSLMGLLMKTRGDYDLENRPLVLVIEDADHALSSKMVDNLADLSTLLSATSGFLGTALNLRVFATTNTDVTKLGIHDAVTREMRLAGLIKFRNLTAAEAKAAYDVIAGQGAPLETRRESYSLADLYAMAHDRGCKPQGA